MSHVLAESDSWVETITEPDVLDTDYPATVPAAFTVLANRTRRLAITLGQDTTTASPTESIPEGDLLSPDVYGTQPFLVPAMGRADWFRGDFLQIAGKIAGLRRLVAPLGYDEQVNLSAGIGFSAPQWASDFAASIPGVSQTNVAFAYALVLPIPAYRPDPALTFGNAPNPDGSGSIYGRAIRSIRVRVGRLGGAAHSAMPATKRILDLCYTDLYGSPPTTVVVASVSDPAASAATYDAFHDITLSLSATTAVVNDASRMWFIRVGGESGANATSGHGVIDARVSYSI